MRAVDPPNLEQRSGLMSSLKLLRIEFRRNTGLLFFPFLVAVGLWQAREHLPHVIVLWNATANSARQALVFLVPLTAGLAAWMAGRNGRRRMDELLATTPRPAVARELTTWAATALWGSLMYLVVAAILAALTVPKAAWVSLSPLTMLGEGLLALIASSAIGYAIGTYLRSRFVAPFTPVLLFVAQMAPSHYEGSSAWYLTPTGGDSMWPSVFFSATPEYVLTRSSWFLGLTLVALSAIALRSRGMLHSRGLLAVGLLLAPALLFTTWSGLTLLNWGPDAEEARAVPYQPQCEEGPVLTVCLHPAYAATLPQLPELVNKVVAPLAGIPGAPTRAEQHEQVCAGLPEDVVPLQLRSEGYLLISSQERLEALSARMIAGNLVEDWSVAYKPSDRGCGKVGSNVVTHEPADEVQYVIKDWLYHQAGYHDFEGAFDPDETKAAAAAQERFAALDPAQQRAWLIENLADLRKGKLTLEDLP